MALVTSVVPWARLSHGPVSGRSFSIPLSTPAAGAADVVGTFTDQVAPDASRATRSVKVPPTSMPMRTPELVVTSLPGTCALSCVILRPTPQGIPPRHPAKAPRDQVRTERYRPPLNTQR